jgi:tetratricopeptide (TPR) repeat protein
MNTRRILMAFLIFCAIVAVLKLYSWYSQPFHLQAFVKRAQAKHYLITPPPTMENLIKILQMKEILLNELSPKNDHRIRLYMIDIDSFLHDFTTPWAWKHFLRKNVYDSGRAFVCDRTILIDGNILFRSYSSPLDLGGSMPSLMLTTKPELREEFISFMILHEEAHITLGHYSDSLIELSEKGMEYLSNGDIKSARSYLEKSIKQCPAFVDGLDHLAILERRSGNTDRAIALYNKSLAINASGRIALENIILTFFEAGRIDEASSATERLLKKIPNDPEAPFWFGMIALKKSDFLAASKHFLEARLGYLRDGSERVFHADLLRLEAIESANDVSSLDAARADLAEDCQNKKFSQVAERYCRGTQN